MSQELVKILACDQTAVPSKMAKANLKWDVEAGLRIDSSRRDNKLGLLLERLSW